MNVAANMSYRAGGNHSHFSIAALINETAEHTLNKETQQLHNYPIAKAMRQKSSLRFFFTALLIPNRPQASLYILLN